MELRDDDVVNYTPSDNQTTSKVLCNLTHGYSFILQSVLGVLAFSTLIPKDFCSAYVDKLCTTVLQTDGDETRASILVSFFMKIFAKKTMVKRYREPVSERRPFWIWAADTTKQALGMLEIHFLNIILSHLIRKQECITYLVSFLLDSTIGLLLIFLLLKAVASIVNSFDIIPLRSGEYGTPFKLHYWLFQLLVYLAVMLVEKLMIGPSVAFNFWNQVILLPEEEHIRIAIVIFIVPFAVNVIMFWIVDSILMRKAGGGVRPELGVCYHKRTCSTSYGKLESEEGSEFSSVVGSEEEERESFELQPMTQETIHSDR